MTTSVRDVAQRAGVSVGTVSNVLNHPEKVAPVTVARVHAAIEELGFVRNDAARQLRAGRSKTVGLVVLDVRNPFFTELARGAEDKAAEEGISIILGNSDDDVARESAYLELFEEQRVLGVLISPIGDVTSRLARLKKRGTPAVLVDRPADDSGFSSVAVDDIAGGYSAVHHLITQGCTRIAYIAAQFEIRQVTDRLEGARRAVAESNGVTLEVITSTGLTVVDGRRSGEEIIRRTPDRRPDGIFTVNDLMAVGVLQALVMTGRVRVPHDIALIGYDDIDFASAAVVPLSSIRQPAHLIGETAIDILLSEASSTFASPRSVVFQPELVVRASSQRN